jgi:hypothetical protein
LRNDPYVGGLSSAGLSQRRSFLYIGLPCFGNEFRRVCRQLAWKYFTSYEVSAWYTTLSRLRQVLLDLLLNAIQAMPGEALKRCYAQGEISQEQYERMFSGLRGVRIGAEGSGGSKHECAA